jgi:hypothetical protein
MQGVRWRRLEYSLFIAESQAREKYFQDEQKKWLDQQIREKQATKNRERFEDNLYAQQTLEITRMRGMLEDEFAQKKTDIKVSQKDYNLDLAKEKRDREEQERREKLAFEQNEVRVLQERGVRRPYP